MAKIEKILEKNEKKLDISMFLSDDMKSGIEEYVTIKKLPFDIKRKIQFLSIDTFAGQSGKQFMKEIKKKGISIEDLDKMSEKEKSDIMMDLDFSGINKENMVNFTIDSTKYIIDYGLDSKKHTFFDEKNQPIELNYNFLNNLGNDYLLKYIIDSIKEFSQGFELGK